jgi:hypothetical protein
LQKVTELVGWEALYEFQLFPFKKNCWGLADEIKEGSRPDGRHVPTFQGVSEFFM